MPATTLSDHVLGIGIHGRSNSCRGTTFLFALFITVPCLSSLCRAGCHGEIPTPAKSIPISGIDSNATLAGVRLSILAIHRIQIPQFRKEGPSVPRARATVLGKKRASVLCTEPKGSTDSSPSSATDRLRTFSQSRSPKGKKAGTAGGARHHGQRDATAWQSCFQNAPSVSAVMAPAPAFPHAQPHVTSRTLSWFRHVRGEHDQNGFWLRPPRPNSPFFFLFSLSFRSTGS